MEAIVTTSGGALNVRRQASRGAALVGTIPNGTTVEVLEKTSVEWWRVTDGSVTGYCMAQYFDGGTVLSIEQRVAALESWRASMGG